MDFVGAAVPTAMGLRVGAALFVVMIGVWDFVGAATFAAIIWDFGIAAEMADPTLGLWSYSGTIATVRDFATCHTKGSFSPADRAPGFIL